MLGIPAEILIDGYLKFNPPRSTPMERSTFVFAIFFCASSLFAQPATNNDAVNLPFTGVYRASGKTSIAKKGQTTAPTEEYQNLPALLATLPKDSALRSKYPFLKPMHHSAPGTRVQEEQRNVRVKDCWILVVNPRRAKSLKPKAAKRRERVITISI